MPAAASSSAQVQGGMYQGVAPSLEGPAVSPHSAMALLVNVHAEARTPEGFQMFQQKCDMEKMIACIVH